MTTSTTPQTSLNSTVKANSRSVADSVHRGIDYAADALHETAEKAALSANKLAESADRGAAVMRERQDQVRASVLNYSRQHPFRALAVGLGVGYVLARLMRRS